MFIVGERRKKYEIVLRGHYTRIYCSTGNIAKSMSLRT